MASVDDRYSAHKKVMMALKIISALEIYLYIYEV